MTACVFYDIDPTINEFIDKKSVTFYSKKNKVISVSEYLNDCDEQDKENCKKNISKIVDKFFGKSVIEKPDNTKHEQKETIDISTQFNNSKSYPKMTTEQFFKKLHKDRKRRDNIKLQNNIHNWYRYNRDNIDELFFKGLHTFQDHGVEINYDIKILYDHFVEDLYYKS